MFRRRRAAIAGAGANGTAVLVPTPDVAPLTLPRNLCAIPHLPFFFRLTAYSPFTLWVSWMSFANLVFAAYLAFVLYGPAHGFGIAALIWPVGIALLNFTLRLFCVRKHWVLMRYLAPGAPEERASIFWDEQEWWARDSNEWPASWRIPLGSDQPVFIDATDPQNLRRFDPWAAPLPSKTDTAVSVSDLLQATIEARAIAEALSIERSTAENIQLGILMAGIGIAGVAIFLGSNVLLGVLQGQGR